MRHFMQLSQLFAKMISASDCILLKHTVTIDIYAVKDKMCPDLFYLIYTVIYGTIRQRQEA